MHLSLLLHLYQPPTQNLSLTKKICDESYRKIAWILEKTGAKLNINLPASLSLQLKTLKEEDLLKRLRALVKSGQIELTSTAAFHPLLPRLNSSEIERQIRLNDEINRVIIGKDFYCPKGFFPPEMAYSNRLVKVLEALNLKWVILDEHSFPDGLERMSHGVSYQKDSTNRSFSCKKHLKLSINQKKPEEKLGIIFRNENLSVKIAYSDIKRVEEFNLEINKYDKSEDKFLIMAMDGETFGHHQKGQDDFLLDLLRSRKDDFVTISEVEKYIRIKKGINPLESSWSVTDHDMREKIYWPNWSYPGNKLQAKQWKLTELALNAKLKSSGRNMLDQALHSDQYWWASGKPYWNPSMVKKGAYMLISSVKNGQAEEIVVKEAEKIYKEIIEMVGGEEEKAEFLKIPKGISNF